MFKSEVSIGRTPSIIFFLILSVSVISGGVIFTYMLRAAPAIYVNEALGTALLRPARHDIAYNEAMAERFLNLYANYNHHNFRAKMWWAAQMCRSDLGQLILNNAGRVDENNKVFSISRITEVTDKKVEYDNPRKGESYHAFEVIMTDFYGNAEGKPQRAVFLIKVKAVEASDGANFSSQITEVGFWPREDSGTQDVSQNDEKGNI